MQCEQHDEAEKCALPVSTHCECCALPVCHLAVCRKKLAEEEQKAKEEAARQKEFQKNFEACLFKYAVQ